ncbi:MAG: alpha/beta fold family hydrolase [Hydrocarboniphaga sp.]|nr:alpha/beta fold family hydrolase [Hydrocarboniphaga sp.]
MRGKLGDALEKRNEEILRALENGSTVDAVPQELMPLYRPSAQPYLMSWLRMRPIDELKALSMPTLIVQGTRDVQVSELDARALQAASPGAGLAIIDDMNHVLKAVADDPAEQMAAYSDPKFPIAGQLVESIVRFLKQARGPA